jgi:ribonuclease D
VAPTLSGAVSSHRLLNMEDWIAQVEAACVRERWRRVSGVNGLGPRALAIVRELWRWRQRGTNIHDFRAW